MKLAPRLIVGAGYVKLWEKPGQVYTDNTLWRRIMNNRFLLAILMLRVGVSLMILSEQRLHFTQIATRSESSSPVSAAIQHGWHTGALVETSG